MIDGKVTISIMDYDRLMTKSKENQYLFDELSKYANIDCSPDGLKFKSKEKTITDLNELINDFKDLNQKMKYIISSQKVEIEGLKIRLYAKESKYSNMSIWKFIKTKRR